MNLKDTKYYKVEATYRGGYNKEKIIEVHPDCHDIKNNESLGEHFMECMGMNTT